MKVQENQGELKLNRTQQCVVYGDVTFLVENKSAMKTDTELVAVRRLV
jgi:hypothetical protein